MQIILVKNISKIGQVGETRIVADGFGQHLISIGAAELANSVRAKNIKKMKADTANAKSAADKAIEEAVGRISGKTVSIIAKANEQGHLFEGINTESIAAAISKESSANVPSSAIELSQPIKEIGEHKIGVSTATWKGTVAIEIVAE